MTKIEKVEAYKHPASGRVFASVTELKEFARHYAVSSLSVTQRAAKKRRLSDKYYKLSDQLKKERQKRLGYTRSIYEEASRDKHIIKVQRKIDDFSNKIEKMSFAVKMLRLSRKSHERKFVKAYREANPYVNQQEAKLRREIRKTWKEYTRY